MSEAQVREWFAKKPLSEALRRTPEAAADTGSLPALKRATIIASIILAVINLPIAIAHEDEDMLVSLIGLGVLWIPFWLRKRFENGGSGDAGSDGDD